MLIAVTGQKFSGKDTFAEYFVNAGFTIARFADPLKDMLRAMYRCAGLSASEIERKIEGDLKEEPCPILCDKTPRYAMQTIGTEWRNMIDQNLWTIQWAERVTRILGQGGHVIVPDCRFVHEADFVRKMFGTIVRVNRPSQVLTDGHSSELEMQQIVADVTVENNGTIDDLHDIAHRLHVQIGGQAA